MKERKREERKRKSDAYSETHRRIWNKFRSNRDLYSFRHIFQQNTNQAALKIYAYNLNKPAWLQNVLRLYNYFM